MNSFHDVLAVNGTNEINAEVGLHDSFPEAHVVRHEKQ